MSQNKKITLAAPAISEINQSALRFHNEHNCPKHITSREFVTLCYINAFNLYLSKNGVNIDIEYEKDKDIEPLS